MGSGDSGIDDADLAADPRWDFRPLLRYAAGTFGSPHPAISLSFWLPTLHYNHHKLKLSQKMKKQSTAATRPKGRQADRQQLMLPVKLRRAGESWFNSRVSDLSSSGFRLQSFVKLRPGMDIWIMLPGFEGRKATVLWAQAHEAGCEFEHPLHPAIFDHIIRTNRTVVERTPHPL